MSAAEELTQDQVVEVMRGERFVMLSTATKDGKIVSHPMTPQEVTDEAVVWFFIDRQSDHAETIRENPEVNLAFAETGSWLSVSGRAEFVTDPDKVYELWDEQVSGYYEGGTSDPNVGLLRVTPESALYWGVPGGRIAAAAKILISKIRGTEDPGVTKTTEL